MIILKNVFNDKQYDKTYYDVISEYERELNDIPEMSENSERIIWLTTMLKEKNK